MNYPDGMTRRDWDHVEGVGAPKPPRPVLRVTVYLHYKDDDGLESAISDDYTAYDAERDIKRVLERQDGRGMDYAPYMVEAVDAEWFDSEEESYG